VYETAGLVLTLFPDLELALEEKEHMLAQSFFVSIKTWLSEIRKEIHEVQHVSTNSFCLCCCGCHISELILIASLFSDWPVKRVGDGPNL